MKLTYKKISIFVIAGVAYLAGIFFSNPVAFGFCTKAKDATLYMCGVSGAINIGWSFIDIGQSLAIVAVILVFANARAWHMWVRFSIWFVPISALVIISVFPIPFVPGFELSRANATYLFGNIYAIITAFIVAVSWIRIWFKRRSLSKSKAIN
ncbi:hypothetical protein MNBD_CPR01-608 [hydrothermal vent metagenome]|uniref:Uncharacterized protein n=1 Tax=hydrothermal vent metagenome TaxID=652676 RepID=A0A3B0VL54_9ZZZZ